MPINVLSINAHGLNHPVERQSLWQTAQTHYSDIVCVQDTHFSSIAPPKCSNKHFLHIYQASFPAKKRGVLIAIRDSLTFQLQHSLLDPNGLYIILVCSINKVTYTLLNIYAPNDHQMNKLSHAYT